MNRHEFVDVATTRLSALLVGDAKVFAGSLDSPRIGDVVAGSRVPDLGGVDLDDPAVRSVDVETPVGTFEAAYRPWRWLGPEHPTLLYHHGSGEDPLDFGRFSSNSFRRLFDGGAFDVPVNLLALRAPFHDGSTRAYARAMGELSNFVGMVASSTALVEGLRAGLVEAGCPAVTVSGISLGGFVTNLHRAYLEDARFGAADRYVPMFAGAALGEMFVSSVYRWMTGELARSNADRLREVLDFVDAFHAVESGGCSPLLARYDRIAEYDRQLPSYAGMDVAVLEKGHVTGALATGSLRTHLRRRVADS